jgi:hypothetical protein
MAFRKEFRHLSGRRLLRHCESAPTGGPRSRSAVAGRAPTKGARRLRCRPSHLAMTSWLRRLRSQIGHERRRRGSPSKPARVDGVPQRQARRPGGLDRAVFLDCFKKPFPGQRYYIGFSRRGALVGQRKPCPAEISTIMMDPNRRGMDRYARRRGRIGVGRVFALCV